MLGKCRKRRLAGRYGRMDSTSSFPQMLEVMMRGLGNYYGFESLECELDKFNLEKKVRKTTFEQLP